MNRNLQRGRNAHERIDGDGLLPALNLSDVVAVQVGLFRQYLLGVASLFAMSADGVTDDLTVFRSRVGHAAYGNRREVILLPSIACIFQLLF